MTSNGAHTGVKSDEVFGQSETPVCKTMNDVLGRGWVGGWVDG